MLNLIVVKDYDEMSLVSANWLADEINKDPSLVLGLATGGTPEGLYANLIKMYKKGSLDFSSIKTFNLDEYVSLPRENESSYYTYMHNHLFDHVNLNPNNIHLMDGNVTNLTIERQRYDQLILDKGGIDIQLLGVGVNGHIGFNEPDSTLKIDVHVTRLAKETISANARYFNSITEVPKFSLTMGIGSILRAKKIILIADGEHKAKAIKDLFRSEVIDPLKPVTFLRLHPDVTVIIDEKAAKEIEL